MVTTLLMVTVYVLAPGLVNVAIVRYSIHDGFRRGLAVGIGALCGDALYALLVLSGTSVFLSYLPLQILLSAGGMVVLFYMGVQALRPPNWQLLDGSGYSFQPDGRLSNVRFTNRRLPTADRRLVSAWGDGLLLVIANPLGVVFWSTLATSAAVEHGYQQLDFVLGFFVIALVLSVLLVVVACQFKVLFTPRGLLGISRLCGIILIGLGLKLGLFLLELV